ncbi:hypothetical protein BG74_08800 [Sodalis-like endosymbiont of Proechinophthirus fluctus]|uniref:hypothetical protein n=1 Tax=Sodalis-like endosymbiont of Proechinophthirus fluctus TaxID=1462730 RepID=UPI0007A7FF34|nr:hypothetical protein [Sodalis-like endosymbiont of Proechinophthirus fluctus]KYP95406.1 hypothetical protein BG74_08800 [Sodalis-like endosymbiont of Proechinophthirus fluctus]
MKKMITLVDDNAQKANVAPEMNSQEWMEAINRELTAIVKNAGITVEEENEEALYAALSRLLRRAGE